MQYEIAMGMPDGNNNLEVILLGEKQKSLMKDNMPRVMLVMASKGWDFKGQIVMTPDGIMNGLFVWQRVV